MKLDLTARPQLPLCLLDIDGVIVLLGSGDGDETFEATVAAVPVTVAVAAQERLSRLASAYAIIWASGWMADGADALGPLVGLHDRPFLRFDAGADRRLGSYKLSAVQSFVRDHPAAWVDDEIGEDTRAWAERRDQPTLIIQPDPRVGLTDEHVAELMEFASAVASR
jgi:hypothetical protein